jgi:protein-S-isoprenylcysteine O-methyltransferase
MNPISYVGFYFAGIHFFKDRVPFEEYCLRDFFGQQYVAYAQRTPILIPDVQAVSPFKFKCYGFRKAKKT